MTSPKTCFIKTLGCQMNVHDSERIAGILEGEGYDLASEWDEADLVVINTCSIREKADQKFFSELGRLRKIKALRPSMKIAIAGCIAQQQGSKIKKKFPHVDLIFGPQSIPRLPDLLRDETAVAVADNPGFHLARLPARRRESFRAWVSVMFGCDNFCAYCIVPHTRGREKSRPVQDVLNEVAVLTEDGCVEVTLLGQNVNSYGRNLDEKIAFPALLEKVSRIPGLRRLRFVTSHPKDLSDELSACFKHIPNLCNHIHLPLQSGSDRILDRMNRKYTVAAYLERIAALREARPDLSITTDLIVGFPGETEVDFQHTLDVVRRIGYDGIFAFQYSKRPHTPAIHFEDQVPSAEKAMRLSELLKLQDGISQDRNKALVGQQIEVLVEDFSLDNDTALLTGRTSSNRVVHFSGDASMVGKLVHVEITEAYAHSLKAELLCRQS